MIQAEQPHTIRTDFGDIIPKAQLKPDYGNTSSADLATLNAQLDTARIRTHQNLRLADLDALRDYPDTTKSIGELLAYRALHFPRADKAQLELPFSADQNP